MPILPFSSSEESRAKAYNNFAHEVLSHVYSPNTTYQDRFLSNFYHPTLSLYQDPFLQVQERQRIQRLFHFYFAWFVRSADVDIHHVSASPTTLTFHLPRNAQSTEEALAVSSPTSQFMPELDQTTVKKKGVTIVADYNLLVRELSLLGMLLRWLWILPAPITLAYAPFDTPKNKSTGLRIVTKFQWVADPTAPQQTSALLQERGYITKHEDLYSVTGLSNRVSAYPVFAWMMFSAFCIACMQLYSTIGMYLFGLVVSLIVSWPTKAQTVQLVQGRVKKLHEVVLKTLPTDYELAWKRLVGLLLTDVLVRGPKRPNKKRHFSTEQRNGDVAPVG